MSELLPSQLSEKYPHPLDIKTEGQVGSELVEIARLSAVTVFEGKNFTGPPPHIILHENYSYPGELDQLGNIVHVGVNQSVKFLGDHAGTIVFANPNPIDLLKSLDQSHCSPKVSTCFVTAHEIADFIHATRVGTHYGDGIMGQTVPLDVAANLHDDFWPEQASDRVATEVTKLLTGETIKLDRMRAILIRKLSSLILDYIYDPISGKSLRRLFDKSFI